MTSARRLLVALAALATALAAPSTAQAVDVLIDGAPLNVHVGSTGALQARFDGQTAGEFFSPGSNEANAGLRLGVDIQDQPGAFHVFNGGFSPVSQDPVTGSGTAADPFSQVTTFSAESSPAQASESPQTIFIRQTTTYVNGSNGFGLRWELTNPQGVAPTTLRAFLYADLFVAGSDSGVGFLEAGPPRVVGGINQGAGSSGGIFEVTPWARFEEDQYGTVSTHASDTAPGGGLTNTISGEFIDNGVATQWDDVVLSPGGSAAIESGWRFTRFEGLVIDPVPTSRAVGGTQTVTVRASGNQGVPAANTPIRYEILGSNPANGVVTTGPDGSAQISWTGRNSGTDTLNVAADLNGNGVTDGNEPQRSLTVEWLAPVVGSRVAVELVRGTVLVKLPRGASAARYGLKGRASQSGFIPLAQATTLPVNSLINATKGELRLSSAANALGKVQTANLYSGTFQIRQKRAARPVTDLLLKGGSFGRCPRGKSSSNGTEAEAARSRGRRVRRLWGNGRGRFRTRGRYSSATVRGTTWLTQDHCNGTLTRVGKRPRSSRVLVTDFVRRRTVTLRAGRSYFAFKR